MRRFETFLVQFFYAQILLLVIISNDNCNNLQNVKIIILDIHLLYNINF